jgi:hypothetical protein
MAGVGDRAVTADCGAVERTAARKLTATRSWWWRAEKSAAFAVVLDHDVARHCALKARNA